MSTDERHPDAIVPTPFLLCLSLACGPQRKRKNEKRNTKCITKGFWLDAENAHDIVTLIQYDLLTP